MEEITRSIIDYLAIHARQSRRKTAIVCEDQEIDYGDHDDWSARCRGCFRGLGLERGDRVALFMNDCPEWIIAFLGIIGLGAVAAPCSTMLGAAEIGSILDDCGARIAVITADQCLS